MVKHNYIPVFTQIRKIRQISQPTKENFGKPKINGLK